MSEKGLSPFTLWLKSCSSVHVGMGMWIDFIPAAWRVLSIRVLSIIIIILLCSIIEAPQLKLSTQYILLGPYKYLLKVRPLFVVNEFLLTRVVTSPRIVILAAMSDQGLYIHAHIAHTLINGMITHAEGVPTPLPPIEYEVHSSGSRSAVCVKCTFSDNTLKNCVAVVHQQIS